MYARLCVCACVQRKSCALINADDVIYIYVRCTNKSLIFLFLPFYDYLRLSLINLADLPRILARRKTVFIRVFSSFRVFSCQSKRYHFIYIHCYGMICMN